MVRVFEKQINESFWFLLRRVLLQGVDMSREEWLMQCNAGNPKLGDGNAKTQANKTSP